MVGDAAEVEEEVARVLQCQVGSHRFEGAALRRVANFNLVAECDEAASAALCDHLSCFEQGVTVEKQPTVLRAEGAARAAVEPADDSQIAAAGKDKAVGLLLERLRLQSADNDARAAHRARVVDASVVDGAPLQLNAATDLVEQNVRGVQRAARLHDQLPVARKQGPTGIVVDVGAALDGRDPTLEPQVCDDAASHEVNGVVFDAGHIGRVHDDLVEDRALKAHGRRTEGGAASFNQYLVDARGDVGHACANDPRVIPDMDRPVDGDITRRAAAMDIEPTVVDVNAAARDARAALHRQRAEAGLCCCKTSDRDISEEVPVLIWEQIQRAPVGQVQGCVGVVALAHAHGAHR